MGDVFGSFQELFGISSLYLRRRKHLLVKTKQTNKQKTTENGVCLNVAGAGAGAGVGVGKGRR